METMHYQEKKKNTKLVPILLCLFLVIGGAIILLAVNSEQEPTVIGKQESDIQRLVDIEKEDETAEANENSNISYEVKDVNFSESSDSKISANMTLPSVYVAGEELSDLNSKITEEYNTLYTKLKEQMKSADSKYTYIVSYNTYENMVGTSKILSITVYQRVRDDSASKNTTEKVTTYNIDLAKKELVDETLVAQTMLGKDYKTIIKSAAQDYVVGQGMMKDSEFTYAITGLEDYYIKDGVFHIIFNEGKLVDTKYGVLDIEVKADEN